MRDCDRERGFECPDFCFVGDWALVLGFGMFIWRGLLFGGQRKGGLSSVLLGAWLRPFI